MIKKCADRARAASENNWQKEREKTHLKTTPQRHTQSTKNTEVTNAESRMENSGREGQKGGLGETLQLLQGSLAGWAKKQSTESADGL